MDGFWLVFHDSNLENGYELYMLEGVYRHTDGLFLCTDVVLQIARGVSFYKHHALTLLSCLVTVLNVGVMCAAARSMRRMEGAQIVEKRTRLVMWLRIWRTLSCAALDITAPPGVLGLSSGSPVSTVRAIPAIEVAHSVILCFGLHLKFEHLLVHKIGQSIILLLVKTPRFCAYAVSLRGGCMFLFVERVIGMVVEEILISLYPTYSSDAKTQAKDPGLHLAAFIIIYWHMILSYIHWLSERKMRASFLASLEGNSPERASLVEQLKGRSWLNHFWVVTVCWLITWDGLGWVLKLWD